MPHEAGQVRPARPADLPQVAGLAAEHAAYERAAPPPGDLADRLATLLFAGSASRLHCLVAEVGGKVVGYATCSAEVSTQAGREYLHMDCLFLRADHRGGGLGRQLVDAVIALAGRLGLAEVQWQTPPWNTGAIRFYERLGARSSDKLRFKLHVP